MNKLDFERYMKQYDPENDYTERIRGLDYALILANKELLERVENLQAQIDLILSLHALTDDQIKSVQVMLGILTD